MCSTTPTSSRSPGPWIISASPVRYLRQDRMSLGSGRSADPLHRELPALDRSTSTDDFADAACEDDHDFRSVLERASARQHREWRREIDGPIGRPSRPRPAVCLHRRIPDRAARTSPRRDGDVQGQVYPCRGCRLAPPADATPSASMVRWVFTRRARSRGKAHRHVSVLGRDARAGGSEDPGCAIARRQAWSQGRHPVRHSSLCHRARGPKRPLGRQHRTSTIIWRRTRLPARRPT